MEKNYYVYILTNAHHTTFYTGVTSDLVGRVHQHKEKLADGFTKKYNIDKLIYFEETTDANAAIHREKIIKKWRRNIKEEAINAMNPDWKDLYAGFFELNDGDPVMKTG